MKTEKITVNLSAVELAQIDFLVERGLYASRSDFIRLATRKQSEEHKKEIENFVDFSSQGGMLELVEGSGDLKIWGLGVVFINQDEVERLIRTSGKIDIRVIGVLNIDKAIDPEQFKGLLKRVKVSGKIVATPEIKEIIEAFNQKI